MTEIRVPTLGESVTEATIGRWFKKAGDAVAVDEPLVELETDKVTIEVPAPSAGTLGEIVAKDGETVAVGALLGQISEGAAARQAAPQQPPKAAAACRNHHRPPAEDRQHQPIAPAPASPAEPDAAKAPPADAPLAPSVRRISAESGVDAADRAGLRQGRPRHQGRHAGGDREGGLGADPGQSARRRRAGPRAVAGRRRRARGAREDDPAAPDHRAPAQGSAEHRRDADDLQRGRHEPRHGAAHASTRTCSRRSTAPSSASWASSPRPASRR